MHNTGQSHMKNTALPSTQGLRVALRITLLALRMSVRRHRCLCTCRILLPKQVWKYKVDNLNKFDVISSNIYHHQYTLLCILVLYFCT